MLASNAKYDHASFLIYKDMGRFPVKAYSYTKLLEWPFWEWVKSRCCLVLFSIWLNSKTFKVSCTVNAWVPLKHNVSDWAEKVWSRAFFHLFKSSLEPHQTSQDKMQTVCQFLNRLTSMLQTPRGHAKHMLQACITLHNTRKRARLVLLPMRLLVGYLRKAEDVFFWFHFLVMKKYWLNTRNHDYPFQAEDASVSPSSIPNAVMGPHPTQRPHCKWIPHAKDTADPDRRIKSNIFSN